MIKKVSKTLGCYALFFIGGILSLILLLVAWFYATCPVYTFEEPKPFAGSSFYNPYQNIDVDGWRKCIFHLHSKSWGGATNGDNTVEEVLETYQKLKYDVVAFSNYMSIERTNSNDPLYIPAYEHGYGFNKTHQLALGADKVVWRDYLFPQNLNQKQHIINLLKKHSRYVVINHPSRKNSYPPENFKYLSDYDFIEIQNGSRSSVAEAQWDAALSNGHTAWLIANDDAHSTLPSRLQRDITFVNISELNTGDEVLERLSQGVAFGIRFPRNKQVTMEEKIREIELISFPIAIQVCGDSLLQIIWQRNMEQIDFIGDSGKRLKTVTNSDSASYLIRSEDTYVRVKLNSPEGLVYYLNPIIRGNPVKQSLHSIDKTRTIGKRIIAVMIFGGIIICCIRFFNPRNKRFVRQ